jgi:transcriptional regulator with XRE-family HTH domain
MAAKPNAKKDSPRLGSNLKQLRRREQLTQQQLADKLQISPAYLNLIENNRRPLPAHLLIQLATLFKLDLAAFAQRDEGQLQSDLLEVFGDPIFDAAELVSGDVREIAAQQPAVARAILTLYRSYKGAATASAVTVDATAPGELPSEQVSDLLQAHMNYFPELEELAEQTRRDARVIDDDLTRALVRYLEEKHAVTVEVARA